MILLIISKILVNNNRGKQMNEEQTNDLLSLINKMNSTVNSQIKSSYNEIKNQTKRLTWYDQLVSDELLLKIEPSILRSSMTEDEYIEFIKKYPDYELSYSIENLDVITIDDETKTYNPKLISEDFSLNHQIDIKGISKKIPYLESKSESEAKVDPEEADNTDVNSETEKTYEVFQNITENIDSTDLEGLNKPSKSNILTSDEHETDDKYEADDEYEYEDGKINIKSILAWIIITVITAIGLWLILK